MVLASGEGLMLYHNMVGGLKWQDRASMLAWISVLNKATNIIREGPTLMITSNPNYFPNVPPPNSTSMNLGVKFLTMSFWGIYSNYSKAPQSLRPPRYSTYYL
jgi:hypothetical protein